jgi:hypothetical protein
MNLLANLETSFEKLESIKNQLFDVVTLPLFPNVDGFETPSAFANYRKEGGQSFGVVGKDYVATQPKLLFESFEESFLQFSDLDATKLEYKELKGGAKVFFKVPFGKIQFTNKRGEPDESILNLHLQTGFDGLTKTTLYLSMYRLICSNGMKGFATEFALSYKNTKNNAGRVHSITMEVGKAMSQSKNLNELVERCNAVSINTKLQEEFIKQVLGYNNAMRQELSTKATNILDNLMESMELEFSRTGETVWGLVNGVTYFTNHVQSKRGDTDSHIYVDNGLKMNDKAQKAALALI